MSLFAVRPQVAKRALVPEVNVHGPADSAECATMITVMVFPVAGVANTLNAAHPEVPTLASCDSTTDVGTGCGVTTGGGGGGAEMVAVDVAVATRPNPSAPRTFTAYWPARSNTCAT